jgi:hypothetical protein
MRVEARTLLEALQSALRTDTGERRSTILLRPDQTCDAGEGLVQFWASCLGSDHLEASTSRTCGWSLAPGSQGPEVTVVLLSTGDATANHFVGARLGVFSDKADVRTLSLMGTCKATGKPFALTRPTS